MTDSTTTKAASNSGDTATAAPKKVPAQRTHGIERLREEECYHLANLIGDCFGEADHLVKKVQNKAFNRSLDYDGSKGTQPLDRAEARKILSEAYDCAALGLAYLFEVSQHLQDDEPAHVRDGLEEGLTRAF